MIKNLFKRNESKIPKLSAILLGKIRVAEEMLKNASDNELKQLYLENKGQYKDDSKEQKLLIEHHAIISEVIRRTMNLKSFDGQILAGIYLKDGNIVEMKTGEGKTLAAVFAACYLAKDHKGVHVLTFNDYLSERDAKWTMPIYDFLGYSVGFISERSDKKDRKKGYESDITYVTAREAGFDFLRDNMVFSSIDKVHQGFNAAIVDEADSILIDEAKVPLVISKNRLGEDENLKKIADIVCHLKSAEDFESNPDVNQIYLTEKGLQLVQKEMRINNLYDQEHIRTLNLVNLSLHAHFLLHKDHDYIIRKKKIEQVDQFTGRVADRRRWPDGLQAAIEAKEKLEINAGTQLLGSIALKNFLEQYSFLSGMTGTALTSQKEFHEFYNLSVLVLPTEKPMIRKDHRDMIYKTKSLKNLAIIEEVIKTNKTGQPILVGTESIEESAFFATALEQKGLEVNLLNAKADTKEAEVIGQAGNLNRITISTAMAGRGTDIKLGRSNIEEYEQVKSLGGLYVIGTSKHESKRIDDQLRGRAGRQGDPGEACFFISLEDKLLADFGITDLLPENSKSSFTKALNHPLIFEAVLRIQKKIEEQNYKIRKTLNTYADVLENQRKIFQENREDILINGYYPVKKLGTNLQQAELAQEFTKEEIDGFFRAVALLTMDNQWSTHLHLANEIKESIHLTGLARLSPSHEFTKAMAKAFINMMNHLDYHIEQEILEKVMDKQGRSKLKDLLSNPSSTYTELITDQPFGEWMELLYIPTSGSDIKFNKLFFWPVLSIFRKKSNTTR